MPKKRAGQPGSKDQILRFEFKGEVVEIDPGNPSYAVFETEVFSDWIEEIHSRDKTTGAKLERSIDKFERGVFGDWKPVGGPIREMRIDIGPGYRIYFACHARYIVLLIVGSDKGSQQAMIDQARAIWEEVESEITTL